MVKLVLDEKQADTKQHRLLLDEDQGGDFLPSTIPNYMRFKYYSDRAQETRAEYLDKAMWGNDTWDNALKKGNKARDY